MRQYLGSRWPAFWQRDLQDATLCSSRRNISKQGQKKSKQSDAVKSDAKTSDAKKPKWMDEHAKFRAHHGLESGTSGHSVLRLVQESAESLSLSARELDAALLALAKGLQSSRLPLDPQCIVGNVFRSVLHPCLLPQKKYLYILNGKCFISGLAKLLPLRLQGWGSEEIRLAGSAIASLTAKQSQELAGNAFSCNILFAVIMSVLCNFTLQS